MNKILVIDDDDLVRSMVCNVLRKANFDVIEAVNGVEGIEMVRAQSPDVIVTDMLMPDKEGIETILEAKALKSNLKIIAMSSGGNAKNMTFLDTAKKAGAHQVLSKPFRPSELLDVIVLLLRS